MEELVVDVPFSARAAVLSLAQPKDCHAGVELAEG
jgi:hypothetical protein